MAALPRPLRASRSSEGDTVQLAVGCLASPALPSPPPAVRLTQSPLMLQSTCLHYSEDTMEGSFDRSGFTEPLHICIAFPLHLMAQCWCT